MGRLIRKTNPADARFAVPLDAANPLAVSEPNGGALAGLAGAFEDGIAGVYTRGQLASMKVFESPYVYYPHDAVVPGVAATGGWLAGGRGLRREGFVNGLNAELGDKPMSPSMQSPG